MSPNGTGFRYDSPRHQLWIEDLQVRQTIAAHVRKLGSTNPSVPITLRPGAGSDGAELAFTPGGVLEVYDEGLVATLKDLDYSSLDLFSSDPDVPEDDAGTRDGGDPPVNPNILCPCPPEGP